MWPANIFQKIISNMTQLFLKHPAEFVEQLKNVDNKHNAVKADGTQNMFVLTFQKKSKKID